MHRILLIDDDEQLGPPLTTYFQRFEMALTHALRPDLPVISRPANNKKSTEKVSILSKAYENT